MSTTRRRPSRSRVTVARARMDPPRLPTLCARGAPPLEDEPTRSVVPPVYPSTTYARDAEHTLPLIAGARAPLCYARPDNPSVRACERALCALEGGSDCAMFSSGMAAVTAVLEGWYRLDAPSGRRRALVPTDGYFAVRAHILDWCAVRGVETVMYAPDVRSELPGTFWYPTKAEPLRKVLEELAQAAARVGDACPTLLWIEPTANPTWDVVDVSNALCDTKVAEKLGIYTCVDATVLTPICCQPLKAFPYCNVVMHSATKYLNGHSDVVAGALVTRTEDDTWNAILHNRKLSGATMGSFDAYLLARGMRTLDVRVRRQSETAMYIAEYFEANKEHIGPRAGCVRVLYPGYSNPSHNHELACRICPHGLFGGMLSIVFTVDILPPEDQNLQNLSALCQKFAVSCPNWTCATSLGGFESLIEHRYSVECTPGDETPHIPVGLLRLSVGLEDRHDLLQGLLSGIRTVCGYA